MAKDNGGTDPQPPAPVAARPAAPLSWEEFTALVKRAEGGDRSSLPALREALNCGADPERMHWFRETLGNPAEWLKTTLARQAAGESNLAVREAALAKLDQVRRELEGVDPSPTERLLAERAACCWFVVNTYETRYAQARDLTLRQSEWHQRRIASAHKRFLSAVTSLARVRKLARPTVQVNIGSHQVNVAPPGG